MVHYTYRHLLGALESFVRCKLIIVLKVRRLGGRPGQRLSDGELAYKREKDSAVL